MVVEREAMVARKFKDGYLLYSRHRAQLPFGQLLDGRFETKDGDKALEACIKLAILRARQHHGELSFSQTLKAIRVGYDAYHEALTHIHNVF